METSIISQKIEWFGGRPLLVGGLPPLQSGPGMVADCAGYPGSMPSLLARATNY